MKKNLLTALAVSLSLCGYAQTKGLNTLGLGIGTYKQKTSTDVIGKGNTNQGSQFSLGYGMFISDNNKIGIDLGYARTKAERLDNGGSSNESKTFGIGLNYQHYYPLINKLYAFAGAEGAYSTTKDTNSMSPDETKSNYYTIGGYGGITWFVSKRFAFETRLVTASAGFTKSKVIREGNLANVPEKSTTSTFNLNTGGLIDDLGFKIYLLF